MCFCSVFACVCVLSLRWTIPWSDAEENKGKMERERAEELERIFSLLPAIISPTPLIFTSLSQGCISLSHVGSVHFQRESKERGGEWESDGGCRVEEEQEEEGDIKL